MKQKVKHRKANLQDLDRLVEIEQSCFNYDTLDKKKFKYFIQQGHDDLVVQVVNNQISGYALILYKKGSSLARLYSVAISKEFQGLGLGEKLMHGLEEYACQNESSYIRLEVKKSNKSAISLYQKLGYISFNVKPEYYDDKEDALCLEKKVQKISKKDSRVHVPFIKQTTEFTCGPAALMMAMKSLDRHYKQSRSEEIKIWREATTIFMTSGHGGCGPHGLALSAHKRNFKVELFLNTKDYLFINSVRKNDKKEIIKIVQEGFAKEIREKNISISYGRINWTKLAKILKNGGIPLVLISSYRLTDLKSPHWIVVTGINEDFVFFNDPYLEKGDTTVSNVDIPVRKDEFEVMAKFGSKQIQSIVAIYSKE